MPRSQLAKALQGRFGLFNSIRTSNKEPRKNRGELLSAVVVGGLGDGQVVSLSCREFVDALFDVGRPRQFLRTTERKKSVHREIPLVSKK